MKSNHIHNNELKSIRGYNSSILFMTSNNQNIFL